MRRAGLSKAIAFPSKLSIVHAALEFTWSAWLNYNNFCCSSNRANWAKYLQLAFLDAIASPKSSRAEVGDLTATAKYTSMLARSVCLQIFATNNIAFHNRKFSWQKHCFFSIQMRQNIVFYNYNFRNKNIVFTVPNFWDKIAWKEAFSQCYHIRWSWCSLWFRAHSIYSPALGLAPLC